MLYNGVEYSNRFSRAVVCFDSNGVPLGTMRWDFHSRAWVGSDLAHGFEPTKYSGDRVAMWQHLTHYPSADDVPLVQLAEDDEPGEDTMGAVKMSSYGGLIEIGVHHDDSVAGVLIALANINVRVAEYMKEVAGCVADPAVVKDRILTQISKVMEDLD